ncbi:MAG: MFS transporter [Sandaracinus sp.]
MSAEPRSPRAPLSKVVLRLGWVSLLTDVAGDLVTTLLPFFLVGTLGASFGFVGVIDGAAESLSSVLKIVSGRLGDGRVPKKRLVLVGYAVAALSRPLIAIAASPVAVLLIRLTDRFGKGIRTAPRDAWIADATAPEDRGRAYGIHRAMDNAGAFLGPVLGLFLYRGLGIPLAWVFASTIVPGLLAVALAWSAPEAPPSAPAVETGDAGGAAPSLPGALRAYLAVVLVFTLATSSDAFILLLGRSLGLDDGIVLGTWIGFAGLRTLVTAPGSALGDRIGRRTSLFVGWALYAAVYVAFSFVATWWHWALALTAYAGFYALTEGAERALVAELAPKSARGAAFGWFHGIVGIAALPASWGFGVVADGLGMPMAFRIDAGLALAAALMLAVVSRGVPRAAT